MDELVRRVVTRPIKKRPFVSVSESQASALVAKEVIELKIEYRDVDKIKGPQRLLRRRTKRQQAQLVVNIKRYGFVVPIIVAPDGTVIDGVAALEAAKSAGLTRIPTICLSHLTEVERRALRIALNRLSELAVWDVDELQKEFTFIHETQIELLSFIGYETPKIDLILHPVKNSESAEADTPLALSENAVSRDDDRWTFEQGHVIALGNALEKAVVSRAMGSRRAQLAICDYPYNVRVRGHVSGLATAREFAMASGEMSKAEYMSFLRVLSTNVACHCVDGALNLQYMDWRHVDEMMSAGRSVYGELINLCVWVKPNGGMCALWRSQHELCFVWKVGRARHINNVELGRHGRNRTNVWEYAAGSAGANRWTDETSTHPTPKSIAMISDAIMDVTNIGDVVLDPTAGSGTTLVAAHRARRVGIGIEIDPLYVDLAVRRMERETGTPARHAVSGLTFAEVAADRRSMTDTSRRWPSQTASSFAASK